MSSGMSSWVVLIVVGVGTYAARVAFMVLPLGEMRPSVRRGLGYVAPAVLAAIALPALVAPGGNASWSEAGRSVAAAITCWLVWRRVHSFPLALIGGLVVGVALGALLHVAS
jgi:branched-subunit amino acid transport protein